MWPSRAGDGTGTWASLGTLTSTGTFSGVATGDVNDDGKLDIVAAELGSGIHIWTGDGAGGWSSLAAPAGPDKVLGIALGDINRDGKLDIAAGSGENTGIYVWTGDGAGGWTAASTGLPSSGDYPDSALGDVDLDGVPDLVGSTLGAGLEPGNATATVRGKHKTAAVCPPAVTTITWHWVTWTTTATWISFASGNGGGVGAWTVSGTLSWTWVEARVGLPASGSYWGVAVGDVDNDSRLDLAASALGDGLRAWTRRWWRHLDRSVQRAASLQQALWPGAGRPG